MTQQSAHLANTRTSDKKLGVAVHTGNTSTGDVETGRSWGLGRQQKQRKKAEQE